MKTHRILVSVIAASTVLPFSARSAPKQVTLSQIIERLGKAEEQIGILKKENAALKKVANVIKNGGKVIVQHDEITGGTSPAIIAELSKDISSVNLDQPIGADPAILATGGGQEAAPELHTPRDFFAHAISGSDEKGNLKTGLAIGLNIGDTLDYLSPRKNGPKPYVGTGTTGYLDRLLHRTTLSLATAKGSDSADKSVRLAIGLNTIFWDKVDPRIGDTEERRKVRRELGLSDEASNQQVAYALNDRRWLKSGLGAGIAPTFYSANGNARDLDYEGFYAYVGATWVATVRDFWKNTPLEVKHGDNLIGLTLHARYRNGEPYAATASTPAGQEDRLLLAGRISYGSAKLNGSVEGGYLRLTHGPKGTESAFRIGGTITQKFGKNLYLVLTTGQNLGADNELFATGGFRLGLGDQDSSKISP